MVYTIRRVFCFVRRNARVDACAYTPYRCDDPAGRKRLQRDASGAGLDPQHADRGRPQPRKGPGRVSVRAAPQMDDTRNPPPRPSSLLPVANGWRHTVGWPKLKI